MPSDLASAVNSSSTEGASLISLVRCACRCPRSPGARSSPLAGSLYGGEGHSRIYEDEGVYALAVEFALETTSINNAALTQRPGVTTSSNPYILPFAMRGILEEDYVKTELHNEAVDLLKQFDDWKPTTKGLKDVKFRLEGIRSKL